MRISCGCDFDYIKLSEIINMEIGLILKIAGIGILTSIVSTILSKSGRDEQVMFVTVAGIIVVMLMLVDEIGSLIETVRTVFEL